jgi:hypothetical protein
MLKFIENMILDVLRKTISEESFKARITDIVQELPLNNKQLNSISSAIELSKETVTDDVLDITKDLIKTEISQSLIVFQTNFEDEILTKSAAIIDRELITRDQKIEDYNAVVTHLRNILTAQTVIINNLKDKIAQLEKIEYPKLDINVKDEIKKTRADVAKIIKIVKDDINDIKIELEAFVDTISEKISELRKR